MGYRSNVRIAMSKNGFEQFKNNVKEHIEKYKDNLVEDSIAKSYSYNLLDDLDIQPTEDETDKQVYFGWDDVKWYDGYEDVDAIMDSLDKLEEQGYGYNYSRIGEEYSDIEERYVDATEKDEVDYIDYIDINRSFNDNYYISQNTKEKEPEMGT